MTADNYPQIAPLENALGLHHRPFASLRPGKSDSCAPKNLKIGPESAKFVPVMPRHVPSLLTMQLTALAAYRRLAIDSQSEWASRARRSLKFCEMQQHLTA